MEEGISVVIPCLNEERSIAEVVEAARRGLDAAGLPGEVIVVDNGSSDRSENAARAAGARVLREPERGYGAALRRGFSEARYALLVMADGDCSYDLSDLPRLIEPIRQGRADLVVGNRMGHIRPGAMPWLHRRIGNPLLSFLVRVMFHNHSVRDVHCGFRAIRREAYQSLRCVTTGMEFASEMVVRAFHQKLRLAELPIVYHPRVGRSKLRSFKDGWRHLRFMLLHSPSFTLLFPGLLLWLAGLAMIVPIAFGPVTIGERRIDIHFMIVCGVLNVVGLEIVTMGLLAKAYAHLSGLRVDPVIAWLYRRLTFEKAAFFSALLGLAGLVITARIVLRWTAQGFGALDASRPLFFALICIINGSQLGAAAYLFSIMALPRHLDQVPETARATGVPDL